MISISDHVMKIEFVDDKECNRFYRNILDLKLDYKPRPTRIKIDVRQNAVFLEFPIFPEDYGTSFEFSQKLKVIWSTKLRFCVPRGCLGYTMTIEPPT